MERRRKEWARLYKKAESGKIMAWKVGLEGNDLISTQTTYTGECIPSTKPDENYNQSMKVHEPSKHANAWDRAVKLINNTFVKKRRLGYHKTYSDAVDSEVLRAAMLVKDMSLVDIELMFVHPDVWLLCQLKINGLRGTYHHKTGKIMSRELKHFDKMDWLADEMADLVDRVNETGATSLKYLDFELYAPGIDNVGDVVSLVRHGNRELNAYIFDVPTEGVTSFSHRLDIMQFLHEDNMCDHIKFVSTVAVSSFEEFKETYELYVKSGGEGIIVRDPESTYKWNNKSTRDTSVMKVKPVLSAEFEITGVYADDLIIDGIPQKLIAFMCKTEDGQEFKWTPTSFGHEERIEMYRFWTMKTREYIGQMASLDFREYTKIGKPFHILKGYIRDIM